MRRIHAAGAAALVALGLLTQQSAAAEQRPAERTDTRTVTYRGYEVEIPASWRVVDLTENPEACVRYDRSTLYLGHASPNQNCPARLIGRRAALHLRPLDPKSVPPMTGSPIRVGEGAAPPAAVLPGVEADAGSIELAVEPAGLLVTGVFGDRDAHVVSSALESARLTPSARPATLAAAQRHHAVGPAVADVPVQPGDFTGVGFDACAAPSADAMDAWWADSPYRVLGVYTSGAQRACAQPNLTADWVSARTATGWKLMPIHVGRQAPEGCTSRDFANRMSADPATAEQQGVAAADEAVAAVQGLGIPAGSAIYLDIEAYTRGGDCTAAVLAHTSGWTNQLHAHGYLSGFYSSGASGIADLNAVWGTDRYTLPDHLWFAWWNGNADVDGGPYLDDGKWANGQRIHQYVGENTETYGGVTINIDRNYLEVLAGEPPPIDGCTTADIGFAAYPELAAGASGDEVVAAQCLLARAGFATGDGDPSGTVDDATTAAIRDYQSHIGLDATGTVDARTWTALLARGATPTLAEGSTGEDVRRLQRALTAALGSTVDADGIFGPATHAAVESYQTSRSLGVDGIVGPRTWGALQTGQ